MDWRPLATGPFFTQQRLIVQMGPKVEKRIINVNRILVTQHLNFIDEERIRYSSKTIGHDREEDHDKDLADLEDPADPEGLVEDQTVTKRMKMIDEARIAQAAQVGIQTPTVDISRAKEKKGGSSSSSHCQ